MMEAPVSRPQTPGDDQGREFNDLASYIRGVALSDAQLDRLIVAWLAASKDERPLIARLYKQYFADADFIQKLQIRMRSSRPATTPAPADDTQQPSRPSQVSGGARKMRAAVEAAVCKLQPPGPHSIRFEVVLESKQNDEALNVYTSNFTYPDAATLKEIVMLPRRCSTRSRRIVDGNFTWFLRADSTGEIACVVTVCVHRRSSGDRYIELPLFATAPGYKRLGLARLLNAALQEHCRAIGASFILVSADANAVGFWCTPSMGYSEPTKEFKASIYHTYKHDCQQFESTEMLVWHCPQSPSLGLAQSSLMRMPEHILLAGPLQLELP